MTSLAAKSPRTPLPYGLTHRDLPRRCIRHDLVPILLLL
jgi:hypothetical protein